MFVVAVYLVSFVVLMGVLVAIHEFGHYYAARTLGIEAETFSIGFGPVLLSRTDRDGCKWQVCGYPLGGYVRFRGDAGPTGAEPEPDLAARSARMTKDQRRRFMQLRSPADRAYVLAAGPAINLLFGAALIGAVYVGHGMDVTSPVIAVVVPGMPAAAAGLRAGDRMLAVDGVRVGRYADATRLIAERAGRPTGVEVARGAGPGRRVLTVVVTPVAETQETFGSKETVGRIGIMSDERVVERASSLEALGQGFADVWLMTKGVFAALGQTIAGQHSIQDFGGPLKIATMSGHAAMAGVLPFVVLMAAMSINVGLFNLFPIPLLDGGQLVVCAVEIATRRPVAERTMMWINSVGFALLAGLFVSVTLSDLRGLFAP